VSDFRVPARMLDHAESDYCIAWLGCRRVR